MTNSTDVVLTGGRIVDGLGGPAFIGDVAIHGDRIVFVGTKFQSDSACEIIDCQGCVITPGLIDAHVHGDLAVLADPDHDAAIRQGVTTYLAGQDGVAFAPGDATVQQYMRRYTAGFNGNIPTPGRAWDSIESFLNQFDQSTVMNVATLIPNGNVRMMVMGLDPRPATTRELDQMQGIIREGMAQGAVGLSSGLDYIPSLYADERELGELCRAIAPERGIYVTHMRGYTPGKAPMAIAEVLAIGRHAECGVHISHFNCLARHGEWLDGHDATFDLYPYLYGSTTLAMLCLPGDVCQGGIDATWARLKSKDTRQRLLAEFADPRFPLETIRLASCPHPDWRAAEGQLLTDVAKARNLSLVDCVCELLLATDLAAGCVIRHYAERQESDIFALMNHPAMMAGSDGIFIGDFPHPRGRGTFAKYLGSYVREGRWSLEEAVRKCSSAPAIRFQLKDRGAIRVNSFADLAIFDPQSFTDHATLTHGQLGATGMRHVLVNGQWVMKDGQRTSARPGRGLRRNGGAN
jgi:N-acyl-D-amino-acid deacylase